MKSQSTIHSRISNTATPPPAHPQDTHARGTGTITDLEGTGAHARIQINFDDVGSKWLVLAYANLQAA